MDTFTDSQHIYVNIDKDKCITLNIFPQSMYA